MILGPVSLIDCAVFCCLLAWQLIVQAGFFQTLICGLRALPFLGEFPTSKGMDLFFKELHYLDANLGVGESPSRVSAVLIRNAVLKLPLSLIYSRVITRKHGRTLSAQKATLFENLVVRCVRHAFVHLPSHVGRVFLSREVAVPFLWFRMLRKGFWQSDLREVIYQDGSKVSMGVALRAGKANVGRRLLRCCL